MKILTNFHANVALFLSYYNGAQIMTTSGGVKFWLRYLGQWNQVSGGGGGTYTAGYGMNLTGTVFRVDSTALRPRLYTAGTGISINTTTGVITSNATNDHITILRIMYKN